MPRIEGPPPSKVSVFLHDTLEPDFVTDDPALIGALAEYGSARDTP